MCSFNIHPEVLWYTSLGGELKSSSSSVWVGLSDSIPQNRVWKGKKSNFTVAKPGRHHLCQLIKVISLIIKHSYQEPSQMTSRDDLSWDLISVYSSPKLITAVSSWEKHQANPHWGMHYKLCDQNFPKVSRSWKTRQD